VRYFASLLVRYENAVASHSLEFAAQNAMRYCLSATLPLNAPDQNKMSKELDFRIYKPEFPVAPVPPESPGSPRWPGCP